MLSRSIEILVPFHDCDPVGIVWHGHYAKYLEVARCALLESFDYNYNRMRESGFAWPIIDMQLRYVGTCEFGQKIRVKATLVEWEYRLKIKYLIEDIDSGRRLTKGHTVQVAMDMETRKMCLPSPPILVEKLRPFLSDLK